MEINLAEKSFTQYIIAKGNVQMLTLSQESVPETIDAQYVANLILILCQGTGIPVELIELDDSKSKEYENVVYLPACIRAAGQDWEIKNMFFNTGDIFDMAYHAIAGTINAIQRHCGGTLFLINYNGTEYNDAGEALSYRCPMLIMFEETITEMFELLRYTDVHKQLLASNRKFPLTRELLLYFNLYDNHTESYVYQYSLQPALPELHLQDDELLHLHRVLEDKGVLTLHLWEPRKIYGVACEISALYLDRTLSNVRLENASLSGYFQNQPFSFPLSNEAEGADLSDIIAFLNDCLEKHGAEVGIYSYYQERKQSSTLFISKRSNMTALFDRLKETLRLCDPSAASQYGIGYLHPKHTQEIRIYNLFKLDLTEEQILFLEKNGITLELILQLSRGLHWEKCIRILHPYLDNSILKNEYVAGIIMPSIGAPDELELPEGIYAFSDNSSDSHFSYRASAHLEQSSTILIKLDSPFQIISFSGTHGMNHNVSTEDIMTKLEHWHQRCGITILGAGIDWVDFKLHTIPENLESFADELYAFCPDCIDQGMGTKENLMRALAEDRYVYLWWD